MVRTHAIMGGTEYRNAPGVAGTTRGLTPEGLVPMHDDSTPNTSPETIAYVEVPLTSRRHRGLVMLIDADDLPMIDGCSVFPNLTRIGYYAQTWLRGDGRLRKVGIHRLILGVDDPEWFVDHINGDTLDNRRSNLRLVSKRQSTFNTRSRLGSSSRFKGVSFDSRLKRWMTQIQVNGETLYLGRYQSEQDAARAYDAAAREHFGEYAYLNFPEEGGDA